MRLLIPEPPAETTVPELLDELRPSEAAHEDRPYVLTNFVLTLDGRATLDGVSGPIGSAQDTRDAGAACERASTR